MKRFGIVSLMVLVVLSTLFRTTYSQGLNADGKDFYVGYLYPSYNSNCPRTDILGFFGVYVLISSYYDNVVTVSYFDDKGNETNKQSYKVFARRTVQVPINRALMRMTDPGGVAEFRSMHITAKSPINVQYFSTGANSGGSYLALPTNVLGQNYVVESYHDNPGGVGGILSHENSAGYFMIIAPFDGTNVVIVPTSTTQAPAGQNGYPGMYCGPNSTAGVPAPINISLRRGQCYMLKSNGLDGSCDISGSTIISDQPVAVIAGHENALTDGSDVGSINVEQRDFMVEQMLPVEYWDTVGYLSIPMLDSKGAPGGDGDEYHVFFGDIPGVTPGKNGASVVADPGNFTYSPTKYPFPVSSVVGIDHPVHFYSTNGEKIHLVQYDQRMQGSAPFPCPSQVSIMPFSRWKTSYLWYVPNNTFEILQGYYISLLCRNVDYQKDSILISIDGGKPAPIRKSGLSQQKLWPLPDYPDYVGIVLKLTSASYYATSIAKGDDNKGKEGFMIYNYGFRAIDPDRDLGDFCSDDHFFSYALPIGFAGGTGDSTHFEVKVDTQCGYWNVCVDISGKNHPGIKSLVILDDPNGDYVRPGRKFYNAGFDPKDDPDNLREIDLSGLDSHKCVIVRVPNAFDSSYVPLYIVDSKGNDYLVELRYKAPTIEETIAPASYTNVTKDSIVYPVTAVGDQVCATITFRNTGDLAKGATNIDIKGATIKGLDGSFSISSINPQLPISLKPKNGSTPGDSVVLTVCFDSKDTASHLDTLIINTACSDIPVSLLGQGGTPLITATDVDFGAQVVGTTTCNQRITVRNVGTLPYTLKAEDLPATSTFKIEAASLARLPYTLYAPGDPDPKHKDTIQLVACFTPNKLGPDSIIATWQTDIKAPYTDQLKSWSQLKGFGVKPGVVWDRPTQADTTTCDDPVITRVNLINNSNKQTTVTKVYFNGPDASEYSLYANQFNYSPLEGFPMNPGDTLWVEYKWLPDLTRPIKLAQRSSNLIATFDDGTGKNDSTVIALTGTILQPALDAAIDTLNANGSAVGGLGDNQSFNATLMDTGSAPYILSAVNFAYPVDSIIANWPDGDRPLAIGDTIYPGKSVNIIVYTHLDAVGDSLVPIVILSNKDCRLGPDLFVNVLASSTSLLGQGAIFPATFTCKDGTLSVTASNDGVKNSPTWILRSVEIVSDAQNPNGTEFALLDPTNGSVAPNNKLANLNLPLAPKAKATFQIKYIPTMTGPVSAKILYTFDSAGTGKTIQVIQNILTGYGMNLKATLSAQNDQPATGVAMGNYSGQSNGTFAVPITVVQDTIPANANVQLISFDVNFDKDLFQLTQPNGAIVEAIAPGTTVVTPNPTPVDVGNTTGPALQKIKIEVRTTPNNPVDPRQLVKINYRVMVSKDTTSDFKITNMAFVDTQNDTICYIASTDVPAQFVKLDACGDPTIRNFLGGNKPARIISLTPNPADQSHLPVLTYKVSADNTPIKVEIFNMLGESVRLVTSISAQGTGEYQLPISTDGLQSGTYNVRLSTQEGSESQQFVLQK